MRIANNIKKTVKAQMQRRESWWGGASPVGAAQIPQGRGKSRYGDEKLHWDSPDPAGEAQNLTGDTQNLTGDTQIPPGRPKNAQGRLKFRRGDEKLPRGGSNPAGEVKSFPGAAWCPGSLRTVGISAMLQLSVKKIKTAFNSSLSQGRGLSNKQTKN